MWQKLREELKARPDFVIISTWIDEWEQGATKNFQDLWARCIFEASTCDRLIVYRETGDELKGALVEVGCALSRGREVYAIGCGGFSWVNHPLVTQVGRIEDALR